MESKEFPVQIGIIAGEGRLEIVVGLSIGVVYGIIRVQSPAPQ
jgi:hypothetical protein